MTLFSAPFWKSFVYINSEGNGTGSSLKFGRKKKPVSLIFIIWLTDNIKWDHIESPCENNINTGKYVDRMFLRCTVTFHQLCLSVDVLFGRAHILWPTSPASSVPEGLEGRGGHFSLEVKTQLPLFWKDAY